MTDDWPDRVAAATGMAVREHRLIGGGHGARHYRATLADGRDLFIKSAVPPPPGPAPASVAPAALAAEASGLRWLGEAGAVPVPEVLLGADDLLAVTWVPSGHADRAGADRFGRDLARLHATGAETFGAPWPGFIASLPLPNAAASAWPDWYAGQRLLPYCRLARDAGTLRPDDVALIETVADRIGDLAGPAEPPSRIHGDCWSGNVLFSGGRGWLIDPAAHGGHRETDLAMLALFGAPCLDRILGAYREVAPLANGWQARVSLHQLHPLLVHVCLFGAGYAGATVAAAQAALRG